jgi:hypothetical protein
MRAQQMLLTHEGYQKIEQELNYLCTVRRGEVAQRLRQMLPEGDILENWGALETTYRAIAGGCTGDRRRGRPFERCWRCRWPPRGENWVVPDTVADYMNEYADLHTQWVVLKCTRFI